MDKKDKLININEFLEKYNRNNKKVSLAVRAEGKYHDTKERFFVYDTKTKEPIEWYKIDSKNGEVVFYAKISSVNFYDKDIKLKEIDFIEVDEEKVSTAYNKVRDIIFKESITDNEKEALIEYINAVYKYMDKDLLKYYISLGKEMFKWIEEVTK